MVTIPPLSPPGLADHHPSGGKAPVDQCGESVTGRVDGGASHHRAAGTISRDTTEADIKLRREIAALQARRPIPLHDRRDDPRPQGWWLARYHGGMSPHPHLHTPAVPPAGLSLPSSPISQNTAFSLPFGPPRAVSCPVGPAFGSVRWINQAAVNAAIHGRVLAPAPAPRPP